MGVVFQGRDDRLGRRIAVKILSRRSSPESDARFARESKSAAKLTHDNVVPLYAFERTTDGTPYLVMPLIDGPSLKDKIAQGMIPVNESADLIRQVALGLNAAHTAGLVHRDVKPGNILLDSNDNRAKLTDFGLARSIDDPTLTQANVVSGTPEYMSPEQIANPNTQDGRSDVYSLGITLYECLTGTSPFRGQPIQILEQHQYAEPTRPSRLNAAIPRDLENICSKAIAKQASRRYQDGQSFADDLQNFLEGRPVQAREITRLAKFGMWCSRNQALATALSLLLVSMIAGTVISTAMWLNSQQNANVANQRAEQLSQQTTLMRSAVDDFFTRIVGDQSAGMQMSTDFRNTMVGDMVFYYDSLVKQNPDDQQLALEICEKVLAVSTSLEYLQLLVPNTNLISWNWNTIKPIALAENANVRELTIAAMTALSVAQKTDYAANAFPTVFTHINDETKNRETMLRYTREFARQAVDAGGGADAKICLIWEQAYSTWCDAAANPELAKGKLLAIQPELDRLAYEAPGHSELFFYRAKIRRYIGNLSSPLEAAGLRGESIELFTQQRDLLESRNETTIWSRRSIALNHVRRGVAFAQARKYDDAFRCYESGIAQFNEILNDNPTFVIIIADLAESEWFRCQTRWQMGEFDQLRDRRGFLRTIELFERLINIDSRQMQSRRRLTEVQRTVGQRYKNAGNFESARLHLEAAVDAYRQTIGLPMYSVANARDLFHSLLLQLAADMEEMGFDSIALEYRAEAEQMNEIQNL